MHFLTSRYIKVDEIGRIAIEGPPYQHLVNECNGHVSSYHWSQTPHCVCGDAYRLLAFSCSLW